ncbi:hypothetical protein [Dietzia cinnamea]|nr:hypothetical protein [Dietzia cinnamea]
MNKRTIPPVPPRVSRRGDDWPTHRSKDRAQRRTKRQETVNV